MTSWIPLCFGQASLKQVCEQKQFGEMLRSTHFGQLRYLSPGPSTLPQPWHFCASVGARLEGGESLFGAEGVIVVRGLWVVFVNPKCQAILRCCARSPTVASTLVSYLAMFLESRKLRKPPIKRSIHRVYLGRGGRNGAETRKYASRGEAGCIDNYKEIILPGI